MTLLLNGYSIWIKLDISCDIKNYTGKQSIKKHANTI